MKTYPHTTPDGIIELVRKDDYDTALELLREIRDNEVNPQDEADKFLRDHQPSEMSKLRLELTRWQSLAERLAKSIGGLSPIYGTTPAQDQALAAYESAKISNLPDTLVEAVKRMEAVPCEELNKAYWNSGQVANSEWGCDRVRARLISAAKGEQP